MAFVTLQIDPGMFTRYGFLWQKKKCHFYLDIFLTSIRSTTVLPGEIRKKNRNLFWVTAQICLELRWMPSLFTLPNRVSFSTFQKCMYENFRRKSPNKSTVTPLCHWKLFAGAHWIYLLLSKVEPWARFSILLDFWRWNLHYVERYGAFFLFI